ncbi:DNA polymerase/3'-5' exonuclease PolX [Oceanobacillus bengalensis]|uniref:DNA-directed DNA polymerase n=1 Tax=Oceanobacillus bengalensis TaxID=1435466 RepID=A0A494Z651_9BACI|nr:DNA polymerase/3'-5' exonuclease PolX [Oceanobacillus bengalensis]RKQ17983.1 DNA polymerase/3'-5' exonuclease PolX [Oceanobacillus bengalensis]
MSINKKDIIKLLENIAVYLELKGENSFKISAYRRAAQALERDERSLSEIDDFTKIKGVGKGTSSVITEYIENGKSEVLEQLTEEVPNGLIPLLRLPGLGGKKLAKLYQELNVTDAETLKTACESGSVEGLAGFGKKTAEKILQALEEAGKRPERLPISSVIPVAEKIEDYIRKMNGVVNYSQAGSLRRMRESIKDIDFIIATNQPAAVREQLLEIPNIKDVIAKGDTKVSITLAGEYDINVDFRLVSEEEFVTTLHHFTGSKDHNVAMRKLAKSRGEKISEYGVEIEETNEILTFTSEQEFFSHFGLNFIPPEARENTGEVEAFQSEQPFIDLSDIQGDLHMHTTWSDGAQSLEEMVSRVREKGYQYMAITDHSKNLKVANGLDEERLMKQRAEIAALNKKFHDFHIFAGVEMDILPDGSLDFADDFLQEMDYVIAAIHSSFNQTEEQIMNRLYTALENPNVSLIAHPTGRLIGRRVGYKVNMEKLIEKAKETNTALEINANPNRLDLSSEWARKAQEAGVLLSINTDAHNYHMLEHMKYGVQTSRRGWIRKDTVINTWPLEKLMKYFKSK